MTSTYSLINIEKSRFNATRGTEWSKSRSTGIMKWYILRMSTRGFAATFAKLSFKMKHSTAAFVIFMYAFHAARIQIF